VKKAERKRPLVSIRLKSQEEEWIVLAQGGTSGGVLMNTVMNTKLAKNARLFD
jgi:hypothetical protein